MKIVLLLLCSVLTFGHISAQLGDLETIMQKIDALDTSDESIEDTLAQLEEIHNKNNANEADHFEENLVLNGQTNPVVEIDPCETKLCRAGRTCQVIDNMAKCVCIDECPQDNNERYEVCTNKNETWSSDCAVYQQRCLCENGEAGCLDGENVHLHIDYYGACHEQKECTPTEQMDFPRRMRDWLFNVMRDLAERDSLSEYYSQMQLEAETNMTRRWTNAAVWKWCDLDNDNDRSVSRHELFPIRAPLVSLEHCIAPFLKSCDANDDHHITLAEWSNCLELNVDDLNEHCEQIQHIQQDRQNTLNNNE